jgi:hypothetical protein
MDTAFISNPFCARLCGYTFKPDLWTKQQSIDISTLSPGIYFMEIHTPNANVRKQIIKN